MEGAAVSECDQRHYVDFIEMPDTERRCYFTGFNWIEYFPKEDFKKLFVQQRVEQLNTVRGN